MIVSIFVTAVAIIDVLKIGEAIVVFEVAFVAAVNVQVIATAAFDCLCI